MAYPPPPSFASPAGGSMQAGWGSGMAGASTHHPQLPAGVSAPGGQDSVTTIQIRVADSYQVQPGVRAAELEGHGGGAEEMGARQKGGGDTLACAKERHTACISTTARSATRLHAKAHNLRLHACMHARMR
eukprot:366551-Chlamydomonas_euryale.AAC.29